MTAPDDEFPVGQSMEVFTAAVRDTAYFLWEQDGRPKGRADEYWYRALDQHIRLHNSHEALRQTPPPDEN